jgi:RecA/RadA recombinase
VKTDGGLEPLGVEEQLALWRKTALDPRPPVVVGWKAVDGLLYRGGLSPGTLAVVAGRPGTRKTAATLNMAVNMVRAGTPVGYVGLEESLPMYVAKLVSCVTGAGHEELEEGWHTDWAEEQREEYREVVGDLLVLGRGAHPGLGDLSGFLELAETRPRVIFVDYGRLLAPSEERGSLYERTEQMWKDLQVWTNEEEVVTIVVHHVGRSNEATTRNHGDVPLAKEDLRYGGEDEADIVFGCSRPALSKLATMGRDEARATWGKRFDEDEWEDARVRVKRYRNSTFLQLIKNRPGTKTDAEGIHLRSVGRSMRMLPVEEGVDERMVRQ